MWPFKTPGLEHLDQAPTNPSILPVLPVKPTQEPMPLPAGSAQKEDTLIKFAGWPNERLSIPVALRAPTLMIFSFACGASIGVSTGALRSSYRYRAENAHRLPTTQTGWFLYQKSKNYHAMLGGIREGVRFGSICTGWATLFMATEEMVDLSRARLFARGDDDVATGQRDFGSTVIAGMTLAGIYSWKRGLDHFTAAGIASRALKVSLAYGLVQDLAASARGNPPAYVSWLMQKISS